MIRLSILFALLFISATHIVYAQSFVPLYPEDKIPNSKGLKLPQEIREERIYEVGTPGIHVFLPPAKINKGVAILVIPGGGYARIAFQNARTNVAKWLNSLGIATIALDYRLPGSPDLIQKELGPFQDAERAMRLIRLNAKRWNVDPAKVGVMGTSAGGHIASFISTTNSELVLIGDDADKFAFRPDFTILVSPVITMGEFAHAGSRKYLLGEKPSKELTDKYSTEKNVTAKTPPTFIMLASDDASVHPRHSLLYYSALLDNKVSATLHIFPTGGHSIPISNGPGSSAIWTNVCELWLREIGVLPKEEKQ